MRTGIAHKAGGQRQAGSPHLVSIHVQYVAKVLRPKPKNMRFHNHLTGWVTAVVVVEMKILRALTPASVACHHNKIPALVKCQFDVEGGSLR